MVLSEVIQAFAAPENTARMEEARESACNDMGKMLQLVLPVATQIQQEVIKAYGFNNEGEGKHKPAFSTQISTPYTCIPFIGQSNRVHNINSKRDSLTELRGTVQYSLVI